MDCSYCGEPITTTRPACQNPWENQCCYRDRKLGYRYCIRCCIKYYSGPNTTRRFKILDREEDGLRYQCAYCGEKYPETVRFSCTCCIDTFSGCARCCAALGHKCCRAEAASVRFINNPLIFAYPGINFPKTPVFVNREHALLILGGVGPTSWFHPKGFTHNKSHRFASVELEVSDYQNGGPLNKAITKWQASVVHDGSIGTGRGFEINTTPACGDALSLQLSDICGALVQGGAVVTNRCGVHVHVDCRDFGYQELQRFVKVYKIIEPVLFAAVTPDRIDSRYCAPCGDKFFTRFVQGVKADTKSLKTAVIESVYGEGSTKNAVFREYRRDHYGRIGAGGARNPARYAAVNLHSYFLRGTIEFRLHHAAIDFPEVYGWAKLLVDLMDAVYKLSDAKIAKRSELAKDPSMLDLVLHEYLDFLPCRAKTLPKPKQLTYASDMGWAEGLSLLRLILPERSVKHLAYKIRLMSGDPKYYGHLPAQVLNGARNNQPIIQLGPGELLPFQEVDI